MVWLFHSHGMYQDVRPCPGFASKYIRRKNQTTVSSQSAQSGAFTRRPELHSPMNTRPTKSCVEILVTKIGSCHSAQSVRNQSQAAESFEGLKGRRTAQRTSTAGTFYIGTHYTAEKGTRPSSRKLTLHLIDRLLICVPSGAQTVGMQEGVGTPVRR